MLTHFFLAANVLLAPYEASLDSVAQLKHTDAETTRIYLVRHGESAFNLPDSNGILMTSGKSIPVPLTEKGEQQAISLGKKLLPKISPDAPYVILSSTAVRAQVTADRIFDELKQVSIVERGYNSPDFCELGQGIWEGKPKNEEYFEAFKPWENLSASLKFYYPQLESGESFHRVSLRYLAGLQQALYDYPNKTIVIATHFNAINALAIALFRDNNELSNEPSTPLPKIILKNCDVLLLEIPTGRPDGKPVIIQHIKSEV